MQFFRINASKRRRRTFLARLRHADVTASEQAEKEDLATTFFADLLGHAQPRDHDHSLSVMGLPALDLSNLEAQFTNSEIWAAVKAMPANKSPGPDGFSWEFFRHCWPIIQSDVTEAVRAVFVGRDQFFAKLNMAFITLLPKKEGAVDMKDFRPISLVHSFAKLIAKLGALHLSPRMPELVDCAQSAFIRGRCIHDNFVLVRQSAVLLQRRKIPSLLLKLDVARAFDMCPGLFCLVSCASVGLGQGGSGGLR
jgi:mannosylglycoprotein endo-beta-mannosidase